MNPSSITVNPGALVLSIYYTDLLLGSLTIPSTPLSPGDNYISGTSAILPPPTSVPFLLKYIFNNPIDLVATGGPGTSNIPSLTMGTSDLVFQYVSRNFSSNLERFYHVTDFG